jgi:hypothetical protein
VLHPDTISESAARIHGYTQRFGWFCVGSQSDSPSLGQVSDVLRRQSQPRAAVSHLELMPQQIGGYEDEQHH